MKMQSREEKIIGIITLYKLNAGHTWKGFPKVQGNRRLLVDK